MNRLSIIAAFFALLFLAGQNALAQSGYDLFQKGLVKERTEGDLDEAIRLYKQIVEDHKDDRALVAKTLVQMGGCYEKLGRTEAQKTYSRVLKEFADQPEPVAQARARLAALTSFQDIRKDSIVIQELDIRNLHMIGNYGSWGACLSQDGSKLVYCKQENIFTNLISNLVVRNLVSGEETPITDYETGEVLLPVFSPDGNEVVYAYTIKPTPDGYPLHIVSLETGQDRSLKHSGHPVDWSRDGRFILMQRLQRPSSNNSYSILSVSKEGAEILDLSLPKGSDMRFSPDGRYLSYAREGNLYLFDIDDQNEIQITEGSHGDVNPIWSPDGQKLIFRSQRRFGPMKDLCYISIVQDKANGDVQVIMPDVSGKWFYSLSKNGQLLYGRDMHETSICTVLIDPQTSQPIGGAQKLAAGQQPEWSPDGKQIAYIVEGTLHVMSADGSNDNEIMQIHGHVTGTFVWAHDNHIYMNENIDGKFGLYEISLSTKERRMVLQENAQHLTYSPETKQLAFMKKKQIFIMDLDGDNLRQVTSDDNGKYYPAFSPDGKQIAFESGPGGDTKTLTVVSVDDGITREVFRGSTPKDRFFHKSWSPDGTRIAWASWIGIRVGQVSDGTRSMFKVNTEGPMAPRWSPDGTKMLFWDGVDYIPLMLMDNFLPESTAVK